MKSVLTAASMTVLLATSPTWAQQAPSANEASSSDQHFLDSALQSSLAEATISQFVSQHGQNGAVKQFAQQVNQSSNSDEQELSGIVQQLRGKPTQVYLSPEAQSQMAVLRHMNGTAFDHQYVQMMVDRFTQDIRQFQEEAQGGQDSQVKSFAQKTLPTLRQSLAQAENLDHQAFGAAQSGPDAALNSKSWPLDVTGSSTETSRSSGDGKSR